MTNAVNVSYLVWNRKNTVCDWFINGYEENTTNQAKNQSPMNNLILRSIDIDVAQLYMKNKVNVSYLI